MQAFKDFAENKGVLELLAFSASNKKLARDNDGNILNEGLCSLQKLSTHNYIMIQSWEGPWIYVLPVFMVG